MEQQTVVTDASPAASSAVPVRADAVMQSLSSEEKTSWQKTGELPERISITSNGETDTATPADKPVEQAASTGATLKPASEPGKGPKEKGAKARTAELDTEISALQERLKLRRALQEELATIDRPNKDARQPEPSTGKPTEKAEWERFAAMSDAPQEEDFSTVRDYTIAMSLFVSDKRDGERAANARMTDAHSRHVESVKKTVDGAAARIEAYREKMPDLEQHINPDLTAVVPASLIPLGQAIGPHNALMQEILDSDFTPELFIHFSTPDGTAEWQRLCELGTQNPGALLRAFGRVEERIEKSNAGSAAPAPKHVSSAPTPPTVLGSRTAESTDPVEKAIKSKDGRAYMREANKRDLAALGR